MRKGSEDTSNVEFYTLFAPFYEQFYGKIQAGLIVRQWVSLLENLGYIPTATSRPINQIKLIDIGCGPGWYLPEWQNSGFVVTGLDSSKEMLKLSEQYLQSNYLGINCLLYQADICRIEDQVPNAQFDLAVSHFNFLNLFAPEQLSKVFAGVRKLLRVGGIWVSDFSEANTVLENLDEEVALEMPFGNVQRSRRLISEEGCYAVCWLGKNVDFVEKYWLKNTKPIAHAARENGFLMDCFEWDPNGRLQDIDSCNSIHQFLGIFRLTGVDHDKSSQNMVNYSA